jgi:hypothetical protein
LSPLLDATFGLVADKGCWAVGLTTETGALLGGDEIEDPAMGAFGETASAGLENGKGVADDATSFEAWGVVEADDSDFLVWVAGRLSSF